MTEMNINMNYYSFIPLSAFIVHFFNLTYIYAQKRKNPVNRAYMLFVTCLMGWSITSFIAWSPIKEAWLFLVFEVSSIFWLSIGLCFLNFSYVFIQKQKDCLYYIFLIFYVLSLFINFSTDLFINGYVKNYWGASDKVGILYTPIGIIVSVLPIVYSLFILNKQAMETVDRKLKNQISLILLGTGISAIIGSFSNFILPHIFHINFVRIGSSATIIQSVFILHAITKYDFLSITAEEVANDLFTSLKDGIILFDINENIIQINEAGRELFQQYNTEDRNLKISELLVGYNFQDNYKNYESRIMSHSQKIVSLSQATVKQHKIEIGKILIVRDITESKKAEEALQESKRKLESLAGELLQANTSLEQKVAERTRSLLRSNEQLQREIADRTYAEEALAAEKERLAVTLSSIGDGVITTDTAGHIVLLNAIAAQLTGWSQEEAMGTALLDVFRIVDVRSRAARPNPVAEVLQAHEIVKQNRPTLLIARNGSEYLIAETVAPIRDREGDVIGAVLVFRDVTEKQRLEEELIKAERLESIGVLAGGIAHDFNNILTAILGNISLAKMYASADQKTAIRLVNAEKAALRAQDLTQQLLTFSKGGTPIKRLSSIKDLIKEAVDFSLRGSNVRCDLCLPTLLWSADIDAGQVSQVIHNMMINADQAMPNGGVIEVCAENVTVDKDTSDHLSMLKRGKYVKVSIKDQGIGIAEGQLQKIFDPYFTTKQKGSGLGLFTSYSIIKKHDGYIHVESKIGVGTTFHIYLPALQQIVDTAHQDEEGAISGRGRILVMEDEEALREVMGSVLAHFGYEVDFASNGHQAIDAYQHAKTAAQPFDVIILDLTIPGGMGAKETIAQLLALDPDVKAIVASGYANDPIMGEFRQYGFCGCIAKPYQGNELHRVLHEVISGSEAPATPSPTQPPY
jgi:PAS domain S-box-containing protein